MTAKTPRAAAGRSTPMALPNPSSERGENIRPRGRRAKDTAAARRNQKEIRDYFKTRLEALDVVKTTKTPSGQTLDWIELESQAAKIADPPSDSVRIKAVKGNRADEPVRFELEQPEAVRGPAGKGPGSREKPPRGPALEKPREEPLEHGP